MAGARGIVWRVTDGVARVILNRPAQGNRIDQATAQALCDLFREWETDPGISLVVVGARGRAFCLGVEDGGPWEERYDWVAALGQLTRPVVVLLQGPAIAEGCELALAGDIRLASPRARLALPQVPEGRLPRHGATQRLPRLIGRTRALDLLLTGRSVGAREAQGMGLVTRVIPAVTGPAAAGVIRTLATKAPLALRYAKEAVLRGLDLPLEQGLRLEHDLYVLLQTTRDRAEGVRAFLEKRRPRFRGE